MKFLRTIFLGTLFALNSLHAHSQNLVLLNANIYTVDTGRSWAEAIAINQTGIITAVGSEKEVLEYVGPDAETIDLRGRLVLPGFQDIHLHAVEAGINATFCVFDPFASLVRTIANVQDCAQFGNTGQWILGSGVNMANLLDLHPNPISVLDILFPERPVLILDDLGHGAWINSAALRLAGFDTAPERVNGNIILRNSAGTPNGVVLENAPNTLRNLAFPPTPENLDVAYDSLLTSAIELNRNGITTVSDAGGYWPQGHHLAWWRAEAEDTLTIRASNAFYIYPDRPIDQQLSDLRKLYHNDPDRLVRFNQAKIYVDGILSQATAAMLAPYEKGLDLTEKESHGFLYFSKANLITAAKELSAAGFQLHFHVAGDKAARMALDAIAQADPSAGPHRLTHLFLVDQADIERFNELGVIADFQLAPSAISPDNEFYMKRFIGQRALDLLPAHALIKTGATVTLSSDWDADDLNPMAKIHAAVSRPFNGLPDVATAIETMTINPAIALNHADKTGSIEVGKYADLVILDANILRIPVEEISSTKIIATLLQGEAVFDEIGLFDQ